MIASAIGFVLLIFFLNNKDVFKQDITTSSGLTYNSDELVSDLVKKDSDGDGVFDWEEGLWGTDPTKKDTDLDGVLDSTAIANMKIAAGISNTGNENPEDLTKTGQFSRELFATVATLSQTGELDAMTVDKLTNSLASQIMQPAESRLYSLSLLNVSTGNSVDLIKKYNTEMGDLYKKYDIKKGAVQILDEMLLDDGSFNQKSIGEMQVLITTLENIIKGSLEISVPLELAQLHLNLINITQRCLENFKEIVSSQDDALVALGAIVRYQENSVVLDEMTGELQQAIWERIK